MAEQVASSMAASGPPPLYAIQSKPLDTALMSLHYIYPAVVFFYFLGSSSVAICTLSIKKEHNRRRFLLPLMLFCVLSYLAQIATIVVPSVIYKKWLGQQDCMISFLSCILVFGIQLASLSDSEEVVWYPHIGPYLLALIFEPALEIISLSAREPGVLTASETAQLCVVASRYLAITLVVATYFSSRDIPKVNGATDSEQQPLIPKNNDGTPVETLDDSAGSRTSSGYGSTTDSSSSSSSTSDEEVESSKTSTTTNNGNESSWERREREAREEMEKRLKENGNWLEYAKRFLIFIPYIWPVKNRALQTRAILVGVCLLANNVLNVLMPRQLGIIIDSLSHVNDKNPWVQVIIYAGLKFCGSEAGLSLLRQWLWVPVEFYSFDAMSTAAYSHVLNLSSDFHDSKSSSDIMMAITSGQSVSNLLESICFSAIPMLIDMCIAFLYLSVTFGPYEGFITLATAIIFLYIAGRMISGLKQARRSEVSAWFEEHYVRQAGIQGWSTVASFNQVSHEEQRYSTAVKDRVAKSQAIYFGYLMAYAFQYIVLLAGLLAGAFLAVWQVTSGQATPGQFIMLLTYWTQLVSPLSFFASLGKNISRNFIQAESLLEIMKTKPTIVNKEDALELDFSGGAVEFEHVCFSYNDKKDILKDITFYAQSGTTIAFVGATGAGKSTILKLLDRFYDVSEGSIKIDGQDVRDVELYSLRSRIGIVPQSPILFNDTVMNNVRYANLHATEKEVHDACRAACIHDQILGFSDGYDTRVGERGVKLSGGELQRVAIARAILKNPSIVMLDEATSSVDTETEQNIQEALHALCHGRTTFVVAHRLSTVMNADRIIVISDGRIVEQGCHDDLISADGKYASLWSKQVFTKSKEKAKTPADNTLKVPDFVNDLDPGVANYELAKVQKKPDAETKAEAQGTDNFHTALGEAPDRVEGKDGAVASEDKGGSDAQMETVTEVNTPTRPTKEDARLNPVAPTFTPRAYNSVAPSSTTHIATDSEFTTLEGPASVLESDGLGQGDAYRCLDEGRKKHRTESCDDLDGLAHALDAGSSTVSGRSGYDRELSESLQRSTEATEATEADYSPEMTAPQALEVNRQVTASNAANGSVKGRHKSNRVR